MKCQDLFKFRPEEEWTNPKGYPFTVKENLKVADSFLGGLSAYVYIPESRDCMRFLLEHHVQINATLAVWNSTNAT